MPPRARRRAPTPRRIARTPPRRRARIFVARAPSGQDHEPDRGIATAGPHRAIDRRVPQRTCRDPSRHDGGDAAPAIEAIENEIRSLSRRIDETRQSGTDGQALAGIERALGEIREGVGSLTPAEQLAGYDEAIRNLGAKLDLILRANDDPSTMQQLESAITALRAIVANVASNDALARLSDDDVQLFPPRSISLRATDGDAESFAMLEQRIAALTASLESREQRPAPSESSEQIESALRALSDRIDRLQVGKDSASSF